MHFIIRPNWRIITTLPHSQRVVINQHYVLTFYKNYRITRSICNCGAKKLTDIGVEFNCNYNCIFLPGTSVFPRKHLIFVSPICFISIIIFSETFVATVHLAEIYFQEVLLSALGCCILIVFPHFRFQDREFDVIEAVL